MLRTTPATNIHASRTLSPDEAHAFLTTFIHFNSTTRPLRNRHRAVLENVPVLPFSPSVLNNLKRIEMGLRGEHVKPAPTNVPPTSFRKNYAFRNDSKKRKLEEINDVEGGSAEELLPRMDESAYESGIESIKTVLDGEIETAIRNHAPEISAIGGGIGSKEEKETEEEGRAQTLSGKDKKKRKKDKKARRKEDKKARGMARREDN